MLTVISEPPAAVIDIPESRQTHLSTVIVRENNKNKTYMYVCWKSISPFVVDIESGFSLFIIYFVVLFFVQTTHAARFACYLQLIAAGGSGIRLPLTVAEWMLNYIDSFISRNSNFLRPLLFIYLRLGFTPSPAPAVCHCICGFAFIVATKESRWKINWNWHLIKLSREAASPGSGRTYNK